MRRRFECCVWYQLVGSVRVCLLVVQLRVDVNDGQLYCSLRLVSCSLRLVLSEGYRPDLMTSAMRRRFIKLERNVLMQRLEVAIQISRACLVVIVAQKYKHVAYTHSIQLLQPLFVVVSLFSYQDARTSDDSALSFPLGAEWLATTVHSFR
ncbi:Calcium-transporting ATPase 2, plasma membrane-type [Dorcoceras hygrometricum]|uniref:Calcium-transporting ATPase 2, plasma membrane-type n=1 Tax=Dorcoceras hygrometricum TaxID=472368 RepID=A0A2Z7ASV6_9LAMI|nr:Calcium-transporting ATPase 2, plasma membrane-type [Dorcoceras hygrometricum]